jgi:hypothetical protein
MNNLSIEIILEMLDAIGYEVVIQEKKPGRRRDDQILIERSNGE